MTRDELENFLKECVDYIGVGFHIDTDFSEYIDFRTGEKLFNKKEAEYYNKRLEEAFDYCIEKNLDIYKIALSYL